MTSTELPPALKGLPRWKVISLVFWEVFKIALFVIGGGYAIIATADDVFGRRLKWLKEGELIDHLPIFQTIPGLIAGNSAIYVGLKLAGPLGAFFALCAVALPSYIIILLICHGFSWLPMENAYVQGAFVGLRSALAGLVIATIIKSWKRIMKGVYPWLALSLAMWLLVAKNINPAWVLVGAMLVGICWVALAKPLMERSGR